MKPRQLVEQIEKGVVLPKGNMEYFEGYGVMGLPFQSGHVLALRCFPFTSLGKGYRSIWHLNPRGEWTFYQNAPVRLACPRYFGKAVTKTREVEDIEITWTTDNDFCVSVKGGVTLEWSVSLSSTLIFSAMNTMAKFIPDPLWPNESFLNLMGTMASVMLGAGHLGLTGKTPNGQHFIAMPKQIWSIKQSTVNINGENPGAVGAIKQQAHLGDFWIPQRGIFAVGMSAFEAFDSNRHSSATTLF